MIDAQLSGGEPIPPPAPTLSAALRRTAERSGAGAVVHIDGRGAVHTRTYAQLCDEAARIHSGMRRRGVRAGDRVLIQVANTHTLLSAFWACQLGGAVAVPVTAAPPRRNPLTASELRSAVHALLEEPWVLGDPGTESGGDRWLGAVEELRTDKDTAEDQLRAPGDVATMLLTSGSTGTPKAVPLTHGNILGRTSATVHLRGLSRRSRTLNWMPVDHIGGLVMFHIRDLVIGCHQIHVDTDHVLADPLRWLDLISAHRCDTTWAPNFAFRLIVDRAEAVREKHWDLSGLRYIMNGGEAIKPAVAREFHALLAPFGMPSTAVHPGWGMTETSSGVVDHVIAAQDLPRSGFSPVGRPHPGVSVRIVDDDDRLVGAHEIGHVQVTGEPVTPGYFGVERGAHFSTDGWFRTGDLGFVADGLLTVTGRVDDLITVDGVECYGHDIESAVEELDFVEPSYTVACEIAGTLTVAYHPRRGTASHWENWWIAQHVARRFGISDVHAYPMSREDIPKTAMGKLRRRQMRAELRTLTDEH